DPSAAALRRRLRTGGLLALVDLRPEPAGGAPAGAAWTYHEPALVEAALVRAGFDVAEVRPSGRFFVMIRATAH
ncbi:MAG: hypothetical protein WCK58_02665, partial [Chloroflexota bacterium]